MPTRALRACQRPACRGVVRDGVCSVCGPLQRARAEAHDARRGSARARGYDRRWERLRAAHLAAEPLCRLCWRAGRVTPATLVDHIVPIVDGGERLDDANLQSLCVGCHAVKTATDVAQRRQAVLG